MSLCLIKPAQAMGWALCGPQGSECDEGRGSSVCLLQRERRCEGQGGRCLPAETWRLPILTGQKEGH